ncbi:MAG: protocatechuate 3,4-dioxygenase subunit alpha [Ornithinimicrobium sp.]|uniref:protocatechuate 3,4-dioxygenase subunit alpha n=1 Tax=Ornithinimicrobium sp. TaxID=1977084 RepID=UPI0026E0794D|nr:protocatechuate 3,4-dioxygenase subunit alpha [Ornithinimicrobium sp.]MDO5739979.1 protocatechuate 3,4-dioxygenase subunit alpha [Ornithinimicrobium sp.]
MSEPSTPTPEQTASLAERLVPTPGQTIGPFYGFALPFPRGHELVPPATAGAIRLHGTVYDGAGNPVPDALLEITQADADGLVWGSEGTWARDGMSWSGWGRCPTTRDGTYAFTTVEPGSADGKAPFFAVTFFARGLLNRLFTRAYLPGDEQAGAGDPLLSSLTESERATLMAVREPDGSLRFDIHLQGPKETVFLTYPRHDD